MYDGMARMSIEFDKDMNKIVGSYVEVPEKHSSISNNQSKLKIHSEFGVLQRIDTLQKVFFLKKI